MIAAVWTVARWSGDDSGSYPTPDDLQAEGRPDLSVQDDS